MTHSTKLTVFACFLVIVSLLDAADNKQFAEILEIKGVNKVEYLEPYLLIAIVKDQRFRIATNEIKTVIAKNADPDVLAIARIIQTALLQCERLQYSQEGVRRSPAVQLQR